jgi:hypothetical protein
VGVRLPLALLVFGVAVVAAGIAIGVAWGWEAFLIYAVLAFLALAVGYGMRVSGKWWEDVSRGRFQRRD